MMPPSVATKNYLHGVAYLSRLVATPALTHATGRHSPPHPCPPPPPHGASAMVKSDGHTPTHLSCLKHI